MKQRCTEGSVEATTTTETVQMMNECGLFMGDNAAASLFTSTCRRHAHKWIITMELEARSQMEEEKEKQKEAEEENAKWFK